MIITRCGQFPFIYCLFLPGTRQIKFTAAKTCCLVLLCVPRVEIETIWNSLLN